MHEASRGPLKGAVSAQKALQGSETEMKELLGTGEKIISLKRVNYFFTYVSPPICLLATPLGSSRCRMASFFQQGGGGVGTMHEFKSFAEGRLVTGIKHQ